VRVDGTRRFILLLVVGVGLALAACGESDEEEAKADLCDARDDIEANINELQDLTIGTATLDKLKASLKAIEEDLRQIAEAQGDLSDSDKRQVQEANEAFKSRLETLASEVGRSVSLEDAASQLKSGFAALADTYRESFAPIDCS
jgi:uncharacterized membrane-anchored protein YjiN (DUF445 family)